MLHNMSSRPGLFQAWHSIRCLDAWLDLSSGAWHHLCITAANCLVLSGSDKVPLQCPDYYMEYNSLEGASSSAVVACNERWGVRGGKECIAGGPGQCRHLPSGYPACSCSACSTWLEEWADGVMLNRMIAPDSACSIRMAVQ
jgi:hypothetical protein